MKGEDKDSWRLVLGNPPSRKTNVKEWILFQKKKWAWQRKQKVGSSESDDGPDNSAFRNVSKISKKKKKKPTKTQKVK